MSHDGTIHDTIPGPGDGDCTNPLPQPLPPNEQAAAGMANAPDCAAGGPGGGSGTPGK